LEGAVGDAVWHAATALGILVTYCVKVSFYPALCVTACCLWVQVGHVAEDVIRIVGERLLVMKDLVVDFYILQAAEKFNVGAAPQWGFLSFGRQVVPRVEALNVAPAAFL